MKYGIYLDEGVWAIWGLWKLQMREGWGMLGLVNKS